MRFHEGLPPADPLGARGATMGGGGRGCGSYLHGAYGQVALPRGHEAC